MECKVVVVYLDHYGHQCRRITSKKFAHLQFGKDEQHVPTIIVKFENATCAFSSQGRTSVFAPLATEGKAVISLHAQGIQIMISGADGSHLRKELVVFMQQLKATVDHRVESTQSRKGYSSLPEYNRPRQPLGAIQVNSLKSRHVTNPPRKQSKHGKQLVSENTIGIYESQQWNLTAEQTDTTYVTASTGVAACAIGGTTLHRFAGAQERQHMKPTSASHWLRARVLLIDEVSMIDGEYFDYIEQLARHIRCNDKPFGGIQLVLVGDFLQLPPVSCNAKSERHYCFQAKSWDTCIDSYFELTQVLRQKDKEFVSVLQRFRLGQCTPNDEHYIRQTILHPAFCDGINATRLCTHNREAQQINTRELLKLQGPVKEYERIDSSDDVERSVLSSRVEKNIQLKKGAQVMLSANISVTNGLANGTRGVVIAFDAAGWPIVKFGGNHQETIHLHTFRTSKLNGGSIECKQLPLRLAWAISIHKSQGLTLDRLEVHLSKTFECGQAYVALSRAKSYNGLRVHGFSVRAIRASDIVLAFYHSWFPSNY
eukprot:gene11265-3311_t